MLILRIKQTECALDGGRLDEAFDLVRAEDMWAHRRGQELAGRLAEALVKRGREHLAAGRLGQADADSQKATRLVGNTGEVAKLRVAVASAAAAVRQAEQEQAQVLAAARQEIRQGHLSAGRRILENLGETLPMAAGLLADVAQQRATVDSVVAKAGECLGRDDWEGAVDRLAEAPAAAGTDLRVRELAGQVEKKVSQRIGEALKAGRLDVAGALLLRLERLACGSVEVEQLRRIVDQCHMAWGHVSAGDMRQAEESARRLAAMLPDASWIEAAIANMRQAGEAMEQLRAGPLGLVDRGEPRRMMPRPAAPEAAAVEIPVRHEAPVACLPAKFLLQVDGAGSFWVLRGNRVTVGPISSSPACDVGLLTEAQTPVVAIERIEDDYFARSAVPVAVNERPTTGRLLASGDRVALSARSQLVFRLPSPASTSAVLDLRAGRLPRVDVRRVILMDRELVIGPGAAAHVRCDEAPEPVILMVRDGRLVCQSRRGIVIDGKPAGTTATMALGCPVRVGEIGFVVTEM